MNKILLATLVVFALLLTGCVATEFTPGDINYKCTPSGDVGAFTVACEKQVMAPEPVYWYVACDVDDVTCANGRFPVRWDYALKAGGERCALQSGAIVEPQAYMNGYDDTALAWVVTQNDAGEIPCAGWIPESWLKAVIEKVP